MKWKAVSLLAVAASLLGPTAAWGCDAALGYLFTRTAVERLTLTGSVQLRPRSHADPTYLIPAFDVGFGLGARAVVRPMYGYCTTTGEGDSEIVFGGGGAYNVWNNPAGTIALNLQAALTTHTFEGGSEVVVPISLTGLGSIRRAPT